MFSLNRYPWKMLDMLSFLSSYKAPGVSGFQPIFFKSYWGVVANNVLSMVAIAFATGTFDTSLTKTIIVSILKVYVPMTFKDFRHISLCNVLFKAIPKVLITQEIVHQMHKKKKGKKGFVMFKIDFEKAYDKVD